MIAFGCSITSRETFERFAAPGIARAREPDSVVVEHPSEGSLPGAYNAILERVAGESDLDGLALLHQDLEIIDPRFADRVRTRFRDEPDVAVIGIAGGRGVRDMAWWECDQVLGCWRWEYHADGGGVIDQHTFDNFVSGSDRGCHEVEVVDGMLLVLSPWAVRELRFDESFGARVHGYDVDICFQARAAGRRVVVDELRATHHHEMSVVTDYEEWMQAYIAFMRKWEGRLNGVGAGRGTDWEQRARRAEAEARVAMMGRNEISLARNESDRRLREELNRSFELESELARVRASRTWRYTAPLRRIAERARRRIPRAQRTR